MNGCFVVIGEDGRFWNGSGWVEDGAAARRFTDAADAYADCALAVSCLRRLGRPCNVGFIGGPVGAAPQVEAVELPGANAAQVGG